MAINLRCGFSIYNEFNIIPVALSGSLGNHRAGLIASPDSSMGISNLRRYVL